VCLTPAVESTYRPDALEQDMLASRYARFRALYASPTAA
jgi:xylulokinase